MSALDNAPPDMPPVPPWIVREFHTLLDKLHRKPLSKADLPGHLERLELIYRFTDMFNQYIVKPYAVCGPGCADCCRIKVEVTTLEADYISHHTRYAYGTKQKSDWKEGDYCRFLDPETKNCSIYQYRPYHCRTFHSMDSVEYCWPPDQKHYVFGSPVEGYGSTILTLLAAQIVMLDGRHQTYLLHDIFLGGKP